MGFYCIFEGFYRFSLVFIGFWLNGTKLWWVFFHFEGLDWVSMGFYWFSLDFTRFTLGFLLDFYCVFTGFYWLLIGFYWVLSIFCGFLLDFIGFGLGFYWVSRSFSSIFKRISSKINSFLLLFPGFLLGFTGFYWVLLGVHRFFVGFPRFYWVFLGLTYFLWLIQGFTGFLLSFYRVKMCFSSIFKGFPAKEMVSAQVDRVFSWFDRALLRGFYRVSYLFRFVISGFFDTGNNENSFQTHPPIMIKFQDQVRLGLVRLG